MSECMNTHYSKLAAGHQHKVALSAAQKAGTQQADYASTVWQQLQPKLKIWHAHKAGYACYIIACSSHRHGHDLSLQQASNLHTPMQSF